MNIQPIDLPSLLHALICPFILIAALAVFRRPLGDLAQALGQRMNKLSIAGFSLELAQVQEMQPRAMDTEIRQLDAGLIPQSGSTSLTALVTELITGGQHDYVVIDLGSESSPRWLTSRLYLLSLLATLIRRQLSLVFVETAGELRKRFVGTASREQARWALARRYGWLESAGASAYAGQTGFPATPSNQFDPATGYLSTISPNLIQQFLGFVRSPQAPPENSAEKSEWVSLAKQQFEHAKWLDGARVERLLGSDLGTSYVTLPPNKTLNDLADIIIDQQGRFVAIVEPDKTFRGLVDRPAALEHLATEFSRRTAQTSPRNS
jgi:hypothetical protein